MTEVLLLDYGGVLHDPGETASLDSLADRLGATDLPRRYFAGRPDFDRGQDPADYWAAVVGRPLAAAELADANAVDVALWQLVSPDAVAAVQRAQDAGLRIALLSNMPHTEADAYEHSPWTASFERLFLSCRIGLAKPDPAIFAHVLSELAVEPGSVTFLDDRAENVTAAAAFGIDARLTDGTAAAVAAIDALLADR